MIRATRSLLLAVPLVLVPAAVSAYPLDGYEETGIRRVEGNRLATEQVDLRLLDHRDLALPRPDPEFTAEVVKFLGGDAGAYGVAVVDLTDPDQPVYAEHRGDYRQNVGSVGKILGAMGYFQALADAWPEDLERRKAILRDTIITSDDFAHRDHHKVRFFDVENRILTRRKILDGDQASVWEYLDWMLSVSSAGGTRCPRSASMPSSWKRPAAGSRGCSSRASGSR